MKEAHIDLGAGLAVDEVGVLTEPASSEAKSWLLMIARAVSIVFGPPIVAAGELLLFTRIDPTLLAGPMVVALPVSMILIACLFVVGLRLRGRIASLNLTARHDRPLPSFFATLCSAAVTWGFTSSGVTHMLTVLAAAVTVQFLALTVISLLWKVSYHSAMVGTLLVTAAVAGRSDILAPLGMLAATVVWARVYLGRHSWRQAAAGFATAGVLLVVPRWL
ncbi:MAG: hypothetical protein EXR51_08740 [Dehalococcoidia bacterium]|nr:hypothetical protein [Dehalococcoidia bacterium]